MRHPGLEPVMKPQHRACATRSDVLIASSETATASGGAARPSNDSEASLQTASGRRPASLVLRVLSGIQKGAQARMRHRRLLVGNLESECDVVLDVGRPQRHACLVRASNDGWTVLAIAGDLWVGEVSVAAQQTRPIAWGDVLTLGDVSFSIADVNTVDWSFVRVPVLRQTPSATAMETEVSGRRALIGNSAPRSVPARKGAIGIRIEQFRQRFGFAKGSGMPGATSGSGLSAPSTAGRRILLVVMLAVGLVFAGLGFHFVSTSPWMPGAAATPRDIVEATRAVLAGLPWANELTVQPVPQASGRVVLGGYLPRRDRSAALDEAMRQHGIVTEHRWTAIDELSVDLSRRLGMSDVPANDQLGYGGQGRFVVTASDARLNALDRLIRRALQDVPAIRAMELRLRDPMNEAAEVEKLPDGFLERVPVVIQYARAEGAPGGIAVKGSEQLQPAQKSQRFEVREVRLGHLSSVVLDNGARYFEGSTLPGGALLTSIRSSHLLVQVGNYTRRIDMTTGAQLSSERRLASALVPETSNRGDSLAMP